MVESLPFSSQPKVSEKEEEENLFLSLKGSKSQPLPSVFWHLYTFSSLSQKVSVYPTDIVFDI